MRNLLIGAAVAMAVAGAAAIATAQDDKDKGPAAEGKRSPGSGQQGPGAGSEHPKQQPAPNRAEQPKSEAPKGVQREPGPQQPKAAQQPAQDKHKSTQHKQEPGKEQPNAAQQPSAPEKQKSTEQKREPGKDQPRAAEQPQPGKSNSAEQGTDQAASRVQVSQEQRTNVRERLVKETRVERTNINVTVNVGRTLPRSVRLHTLPVTIVAIAPAYRGYQYVLLEDETIVIVDPRTYVVVDVISNGGPGHATLALSAADQRFLFTSLPKDRRADVRVRLALGAEVPRSIELLPFPSVAVERVPSVQRYRYIVSGDDIAIVDPTDYSVVLVISE